MIAVADDFAIVVDKGQLPARRGFRVDDVDVAELQPAKLQKSEDLEAIGIVIGDAEQFGVGEKCQHGLFLSWRRKPTLFHYYQEARMGVLMLREVWSRPDRRAEK